MDLSVIIPVHNEEGNLREICRRMKAVLEGMKLDWEMIFINDGSRDKSMLLIRELAEADERIQFIHFSRNFGQPIAVAAGLDYCRGDRVVVIDADLQDPPELIPDLYAKALSGFEVVYARRRTRKGENFIKKFTAKLFYRLINKISKIEIPLDTGDFRIIDRKVVEVLRRMPEQHKFFRGQVSWSGFRQTYIEYDRDKRLSGATKYTIGKMIRFALDAITSYSDFPLKFATWAGFTVSGISFILIIYALYSRFFGEYEAGWASEMISILFIGGIQLICIGIIGEYISRIFANVRNRPLYIIDETSIRTNHEKAGLLPPAHPHTPSSEKPDLK